MHPTNASVSSARKRVSVALRGDGGLGAPSAALVECVLSRVLSAVAAPHDGCAPLPRVVVLSEALENAAALEAAQRERLAGAGAGGRGAPYALLAWLEPCARGGGALQLTDGASVCAVAACGAGVSPACVDALCVLRAWTLSGGATRGAASFYVDRAEPVLSRWQLVRHLAGVDAHAQHVAGGADCKK